MTLLIDVLDNPWIQVWFQGDHESSSRQYRSGTYHVQKTPCKCVPECGIACRPAPCCQYLCKCLIRADLTSDSDRDEDNADSDIGGVFSHDDADSEAGVVSDAESVAY